MTESVHSFQVVLRRDIREDDVEPLLNAIRLLTGVLEVTPIKSSWDSTMAEERARDEMASRIYELLRDIRETKR